MLSLTLSGFGLYLSRRSTSAPRVRLRFTSFAISFGVAPKPARRIRCRVSVSVRTELAVPIGQFLQESVGARDPAVGGRARLDPAPDHVDERVVELRFVERHAFAEARREAAGHLVD